MKYPVRENEPTPPDSDLDPGPKQPPETNNEETKSAAEIVPDKEAARNPLPDTAKQTAPLPEGGDPDPKAISKSLRRIRTSGPLIIEALKQNQDRVNEIIAQSVQGMGETKPEAKREGPKQAPTPPPPPPIQKAKKGAKHVNREAKAAPSNSQALSETPANSKNRNIKRPGQTGAQASTPSIVQTAMQTAAQTAAAAVAMKQSVTRKTSGLLAGTPPNRSNTHSGSSGNSGQLSPNGPSTVLAQASGFKPQSGFGSKIRIGMIAIAVLLAAGTYFIFRDKLLSQAHPSEGVVNLVSPEEQSAQLVSLGEQERAQGQYDTALDHFHRALELAPNNPDIRFLLAQTYSVSGKMEEAMKGYQEILRIAPDHLDARLQLAGIYQLRNNWNAAYREYQNVIELNPSSAQAASALEAIENQQTTVEPETQPVKNKAPRRNRQPRPVAPALPGEAVRAQVPLVAQGLSAAPGINPPAALNRVRPEEKPDPRSVADLHKRLGVRYLNIKEFRAAINEFLQGLSLTPGDKDLYYFIGSSYHGLKQFPEAYDYYRRVDAGPYLGPAQSGAKQTEKAARDASRRRETPKIQTIRDETKSDTENGVTNKSTKSFMNKLLDSFKQ